MSHVLPGVGLRIHGGVFRKRPLDEKRGKPVGAFADFLPYSTTFP